ncbi:MAG: 5-dehydro-2-deoxygluconokinase [Candidatus Hydrogenedentota bacterium]
MGFDLVSVGLSCADVMVRPVESLPAKGTLALMPTLEIHLGGLAGVTATVFARLGGKAAFIGTLGQDGFGDYIIGALQSNGVNIDQVKRKSSYGTPATVVMIDEMGQRTFLHHQGSSRAFTEQDVDMNFVMRARHLHWGGPAVTPALDGEPAGRLLKQAREAGLTTSLDTCYDGEGKWFARIEHALPHTNVVMSSIEEARKYTNRETPEDVAEYYLSFGPDIVLIKMGDSGVYVKSGSDAFAIPAHTVPVLDTTGAGDAACGGFLFGYLNGWNVRRSAKLANAVGGLTVQAMGGSMGVKSLDAAIALMEGA